MSVSRFMHNPTNRHFVFMIVSLIIAIGCFSFYWISDSIQDNAAQVKAESKLNQILEYASESVTPNITVLENPANVTIVVPLNEQGQITGANLTETINKKLNGVPPESLIIK